MIKKLSIGARRKTNWNPVINYLSQRKGTPLSLIPEKSIVYIYNRPSNNYTPAWGKASVKIACGMCGVINEAFQWSLHGSGKKCEVCFSKITPDKTYAYIDRLVPNEIIKLISIHKEDETRIQPKENS